MPDKLNKANAWGSAINNWTKILIGLIVLIVGIGTTYYKIEANASDNVRQDTQFKDILMTMTREFEIWGDRSDKRYKRAMAESDGLHAHDIKQEEILLELTKELWYIKGKLDEQEKHN